MRSTNEKVTGALAWTLAPRVVQVAVSVFTSVLIVRSLGESLYGTLSVLRTLLALGVLVVSLGLGQAINRFVPELRVQGAVHEGRALLYRGLLIQAALWMLVSTVLILFRSTLAEWYPSAADLLILGVVLSIAEVAAGTVNQYALASYRAREMAGGAAVGSIVLALVTAWLLRRGLNIPAVLWGAAVGNGVNFVIVTLLLARGAPGGGPARTGLGAFPWRRLVAYALPWMPNNLLNFVIWRQSETVLLGLTRSREEAGYFDLAYKLPQLALEFLPSAIYPLLLAGFSETATVARERMAEFLTLYYRLLFFVLAPISVLGFAMGDRLLVLMYGAQMAPAGPYCQAFFLVFVATFLGTPLSMAVYVAEKVWVNLLLNVGYAALNVGLDLLLIPKYGLLGATIPTAVTTLVVVVVRYFVARRYLSRIAIPWGFIGKVYLASAPILLLFWLKGRVEEKPAVLWMCVAAGLVTLLAYRVLKILGPAEREILSRSRLPGKTFLLKVF